MSTIRNSISKSISDLEEKDKKGLRDRTAFGYMEPGVDKNFAQCGTCRLWIKTRKMCYWFTKRFDVPAEASCIVYIPGKPMEGDIDPVDALSPKEVGYVNGKVRCENCDAFNAKKKQCGVFYRINEELPNVFSLEDKVDAKGCCNSFYRGKFRRKDFAEGEHEE